MRGGLPYDIDRYVRKDKSNLYLVGDQDLSAASSLILPTSAGYAPTADGSLGYDSTQKKYVAGGGLFAGVGSLPRLIQINQGTTDKLDAAVITTTETAFTTGIALPAGYFIGNKALLVVVGFIVTSTGGPTFLVKMRSQKSGPTNVNLWASTAGTVNSAVVTSGGIFLIQGTGAAGASVNVITQQVANASEPPIASARNTITQPVAISTNVAETIQFTVTFGAGTGGNTMTMAQLLAFEVN